MPRPVCITYDSTCDLTPRLLERFHIRTVPLTIQSGERIFLDDGCYTSAELYADYRRNGTLPKTTAVSPEEFKAFIDSYGWKGRFVALGIQVLQIVIALIPGELVEVGTGSAFGAVEGTLICMIGVAAASSLVFLLTRFLGVRLVEIFISREKIDELRFINSEEKLKRMIFLLFFIPGTPKDLLTYFAGLTRIKLHEFLIISMIARIPSLVSSTIGGHFIGQSRYVEAIILFVVTGVVSLIGMKVYSIIVKKHKKGSRDDSDPQLPGTPAG